MKNLFKNKRPQQPVLYTKTTHNIEVSVNPQYIPERSNPTLRFFFYAYTVTITNHGNYPAQLLTRHWIIRDGNGMEEHVRGDGVIGEQPILEPGQTFNYTSACPLRTPTGNMRGTYNMVDDQMNAFTVNIPLFFLRRPETFQQTVTTLEQ